MIQTDIKKAIILGSGALKIGEAGEFDYSGSQALKALKEEDETILINPNIATIQTSEDIADKIYFLPVTHLWKRLSKKKTTGNSADDIGGQTALNCGVALFRSGVLEKYNIKVVDFRSSRLSTPKTARFSPTCWLKLIKTPKALPPLTWTRRVPLQKKWASDYYPRRLHAGRTRFGILRKRGRTRSAGTKSVFLFATDFSRRIDKRLERSGIRSGARQVRQLHHGL